MENKIETNYIVKIDETLKNLKFLDDTLGNVDDAINKAGKNQSFDVLAKNAENCNRVLANGQKIYREIEGGAKSYRSEINRLQKAQEELIKSQGYQQTSQNYDKAQKDLQAVRKRLEELNAELANTETAGKKSSEKVGGFFGNLGGLAKTAGLAVAGFFAVDKLVDFEGAIIDATKNYQKYFAVLKNGFGDENKATQSLELIYEFASATPFQVNEITESFIKLSNRGFTPTREELVKLGDLAASQGKSFDQLTEGILDATSGEFERLKEFGIRAKTVGDNVTLSFKGNEVTINKFNEGALKDAVLGFGALQGVTGSMASVSQTLEGQISNLGDSYDQLLVSLGKSQGFLGSVVGLFKSMLDGVKAFIDVPIEQKLREENAELNVLANSLILANNNEAIKSKLIAEISQKYPSFLALLGKESDNTYAIESALKLVNEQYRIKIRLAGQDVLAKRNAEELADAYEKTSGAYEKAGKTLEKYGRSLSDFQGKSQEQKEEIIAGIYKAELTNGKGNESSVKRRAEFSVKSLNEILGLEKDQQAIEDKGLKIQNDKLTLTNQEIEVKNIAIAKAKEENGELSKSLITRKEFDRLSKKENLNSNETTQIANFQKFQANKEQIGTFARQGQTAVIPKATVTGKVENDKGKEVQKEIDSLIEKEQKYQETINKIELEAKNVRLSMLDKNSKEYIDKKRQYDLDAIDVDRQKFKELYEIELANILLREQLSKRSEKIGTDELETLKRNANEQASVLVNNDSDSRSFNNSTSTTSQRGLLSVKKSVIDFNYNNDIKALEDKNNKDQLDRLEQHNSLMGEGLEKQIITIQNKYNKLIETYEKDLALVKALEIKRAEEIGKARFNSSDKAIDDSNSISKKTIEGRDIPKGVSQLEFEAKNKRDLLDLDVAFYAEKYRLLKEYLESSQFEQADKNGQISKEEKDAYQTRLENYRKSLQGANSSLDVFVKTSSETGKTYKDNWDVIGDVFKTVTGKALSFSEDKEVDAKIKDSIDTTLNAVKDAYSNILQAQIESSNERIAQLDSEISERQGRVNQEFENYKAGYANNYLEEKKSLDLKKKDRADEIEQKKKLQKEQAVIDTLMIISTNAVTVAEMISASAKAFNATAPIPFVGVIYALAAVATIVATVASISAKAKQATKLRYGGEIFGNLHEAGGIDLGNTGIEAEGGEFMTRREQYKKQPNLFQALNDDTFGMMGMREQHEMLKPFGMKIAQNREQNFRIDLLNKEKFDQAKTESQNLNKHFVLISEGLKEVAENTSNISEFNYIQSGDETLKFNKKGKIVEVIKKGNE